MSAEMDSYAILAIALTGLASAAVLTMPFWERKEEQDRIDHSIDFGKYDGSWTSDGKWSTEPLLKLNTEKRTPDPHPFYGMKYAPKKDDATPKDSDAKPKDSDAKDKEDDYKDAVKCLTFNVGFAGMSGDEDLAKNSKSAKELALWCVNPADGGKFKCLEKAVQVVRDSKADVVCLQEATNHKMITDDLKAIYHSYTHSCVAHPDRHPDPWTLDIVMLFKKGVFENIKYKKGNLCTRKSTHNLAVDARPFIVVTCKRASDGVNFVFVNLHNGHTHDDYTKEGVRETLSRAVDAMPGSASMKDAVVVLMGDFNDSHGEDFWKGFAPFGGSKDAYLKTVKVGCTAPDSKVPVKPPASCCDKAGLFTTNKATTSGDYVMSNAAFSKPNAIVASSTRSSDHLPVTASIIP